MSIQMDYDAVKKRAVYTFKSGRQLVVNGVDADKAQKFLERNAPEFERRDCCLHTVDAQLTREGRSDD